LQRGSTKGKFDSHLVAGLPTCCVKIGCWITAGLLPVLEWFGVIAVAVYLGHDKINYVIRASFSALDELTLLSASLSGNICATLDGEVSVFTFTLVDGFVLEKSSRKQLF
jgi:hypothetical protein